MPSIVGVTRAARRRSTGAFATIVVVSALMGSVVLRAESEAGQSGPPDDNPVGGPA